MRSTAELWEAGMRCFNCGLQYELMGQPYDAARYDLDPADPGLVPAMALNPDLGAALLVGDVVVMGKGE
jgi:hypothetical protein